MDEEAKNQTALVGIKSDIFGPTVPCCLRDRLVFNTLESTSLCSVNAILRLGTGHHAHLSCPNGRKMDDGARQQKLRVPERTLYNAQWDAWNRCWRDLEPLFHSIHFAEM